VTKISYSLSVKGRLLFKILILFMNLYEYVMIAIEDS